MGKRWGDKYGEKKGLLYKVSQWHIQATVHCPQLLGSYTIERATSGMNHNTSLDLGDATVSR